MLSVGKVAKMFGISRTALLYYDSIGLMKPSARNDAGYRLYDGDDISRLRQIMLFREAGVQLEEIATLLEANEMNIASALLKRLGELNSEIEAIKSQQDMIVRIIRSSRLHAEKRNVDREGWKSILKAAGINEDNAEKWHAGFERHSPEQHHNFLALLGFSEEEITDIRSNYRWE